MAAADMTDPPIESLSVTLPFFFFGLIGMAAAGLLMMMRGELLWASHWAPATIGLLHTITLGFIGITMVGALIQVSPVVGGCRLPLWRAAYFEQFALSTGIFALIVSLIASPTPQAGGIAMALLSAGFLSFGSRAVAGLVMSTSRHHSRRGMFVALLSLVGFVTLGVLMAQGYAGGAFPGARGGWIQVHLTFAILGWVGGLIMSVSWQVLPMFYLTPDAPEDLGRFSISLLLLGVAAALGLFTIGVQSNALQGNLVAYASIPAVIAVWGIEPLSSLSLIRARRRKRADASLLGWMLGLSTGLATLVAVVITLIWPLEVLKQLTAWLAIWGWASMIVHAMLNRIVPFLVWYSRFSPLVGIHKVPSMRKLLPDTITRRGIWIHFASVLLGAIGILTGSGVLMQLTGLLVVLVASNLGSAILMVLKTPVPR